MIPPGLWPYWRLAIFVIISAGWFLGTWHQLWRFYLAEEVVRFSLKTWVITFLAAIVGNYFNGLAIGLVGGFILAAIWRPVRQNWPFWELWEKLTPLLLALVILGGSLWLLAFFSRPLLLFLIWSVAVAVSNLYWRHYRSFLWYSSGKIGFMPLIDLFLLSLGGGVLACYRQHWQEASFTLATALLAIAGIYLLSGRKVGKLGL